MPKDEKIVPKSNPPQELPMPKYGYQTPQGGSVSSRYREDDTRPKEPAHALQNIRFG